MKQMGRAHRHYYRIVAIDAKQPRGGRVIEELGTYAPHDKSADKHVTLVPDRIKYWMSVGAKPSERVETLLKKYLEAAEKKIAMAATAASTTPAPEAAPEQS